MIFCMAWRLHRSLFTGLGFRRLTAPGSGRGQLQTRRSVPANGPGSTAGQSMSFGEEHVLPGFGFVLQRSDANHEVEHGMDLARSLGEDEIGAHHDRVYLVLRHFSLLTWSPLRRLSAPATLIP